jgi:hypothetical protein
MIKSLVLFNSNGPNGHLLASPCNNCANACANFAKEWRLGYARTLWRFGKSATEQLKEHLTGVQNKAPYMDQTKGAKGTKYTSNDIKCYKCWCTLPLTPLHISSLHRLLKELSKRSQYRTRCKRVSRMVWTCVGDTSYFQVSNFSLFGVWYIIYIYIILYIYIYISVCVHICGPDFQ